MNFFFRLSHRLTEYPLSRRLLVYVVLCSSLFALLATAAQLYLEYRRDVSALNNSLRFIQKSYLPSIAASTYKIDSAHLQLELEGALKLPDIVYLEVRELRGNEIHTHAHGDPNAVNIIRKDYPLEYLDPSGGKRSLGSLRVFASLGEVYQRLWSRVVNILLTNMVKTFLASACILAIIHFLITRHLTKIASYTRHLVPGRQDSRLTLNRRSRETNKPDELEHVVSAINDLQERTAGGLIKQREAELKYRTVADYTYDWEYWANFDGNLHYISPSCERISGYTAQEFIANPSLFREIVVPEDKDIWDEHYSHSREALGQHELQFRILRRDGKLRWIEHACQPVYDTQGNPIGVRVSNRDITARKQAEIDLKRSYTEIEQLKNHLEAETAYLQEEIRMEHNIEGIIGQSAAIQYVLYKVQQVAESDMTVLVLGETGTGKELVCRAIHSHSLRKSRPLVKVDCAALPSNLIESELFGHERGAFTGARDRRIGRFEIANRSSIFLDEVGELPPELQSKLLRVLQDGDFERLGSSMTIHVDVRVIAATNRNLEALTREGRFREDLLYRLNAFPITIPPLRERAEDIPRLARFFLDRTAKHLGRNVDFISEGVMNTLQQYPWPGNVRELQNVIERAVLNSSGPKLILVDDLLCSEAGRDDDQLKSLNEIETDHILRVLETTNWRIDGPKGAARILDINPSTLRSRMRKLGIQKPSFNKT